MVEDLGLDLDLLPCGCRMGTRETSDGPAFVMRPCSPDCDYYRYAMNSAREMGKPVRAEYDGRPVKLYPRPKRRGRG